MLIKRRIGTLSYQRAWVPLSLSDFRKFRANRNNMALLNCPDCKHELSDKAKTCPNCGRPKDRKSISGPAVVFVAACGYAVVQFVIGQEEVGIIVGLALVGIAAIYYALKIQRPL